MGIDTIVRKTWHKNKEFLIASGTYIAASTADYLITLEGFRQTFTYEGNPVIDDYITQFGVEDGILIPKIVIGTCMLTLIWCVDKFHEEKKTRIKSKYILYPAALVTALTGSSWYIAQYFMDTV